MRRRSVLALCVVLGVSVLAAMSAGSARAADECKGLRVCLPVAGPWVVVPAGGKEGQDVPRGTLASILRQAGLK